MHAYRDNSITLTQVLKEFSFHEGQAGPIVGSSQRMDSQPYPSDMEESLEVCMNVCATILL